MQFLTIVLQNIYNRKGLLYLHIQMCRKGRSFLIRILEDTNTGEIQVRSDDSEAFEMTSTRTATVSACLNLEEVSLRSSWSEKVRTRSRKRSVSRELYL